MTDVRPTAAAVPAPPFVMSETLTGRRAPSVIALWLTAGLVAANVLLITWLWANGGDFHRNHHTVHIVIGLRESHTGQGIGKRLFEACENWAREKGCTEMASDTWLDNQASIRAHAKMGYYEAERLVHFVKQL